MQYALQVAFGQIVLTPGTVPVALGAAQVTAQRLQLLAQAFALLAAVRLLHALAQPVHVAAQPADPVIPRADLGPGTRSVLRYIVNVPAIGIADQEVRLILVGTDPLVDTPVAAGVKAAIRRAVFQQPALAGIEIGLG